MHEPRDAHPELPEDPDSVMQDDGPPRPHHAQPLLLGLVALGGFLGAATRYGVALVLPSASGRWPTGTFVVNLVGAFILGALLEGLARGGPDAGWRRRARLLVGTGFCGALTTYSTLAVETDLLVRDGAPGLALAYVVVSVVAGLFASAVGIAVAVGHHRRGRPRKAAA
jgi:CrcB protein